MKGSWRVLSVQGSLHIFHFFWPDPNENNYWLYFCILCNKNAAKWSRQHAGEKYREYAQRSVCFVNKQVPWPHSNINVKFCTSRLCMKMSSFLFVHALAMPRILYIACGVPFPVWTPDNISGLISVVLWLLRWEVIQKISGNILLSGGRGGGKLFFEVVFVFKVIFIFRSSSFLRSSLIWGRLLNLFKE